MYYLKNEKGKDGIFEALAVSLALPAFTAAKLHPKRQVWHVHLLEPTLLLGPLDFQYPSLLSEGEVLSWLRFQ